MGVSNRRFLAASFLLLAFVLVPAFLTPAADASHEAAAALLHAPARAASTPEEVRARLDSIGVPGYVESGPRGGERWTAVRAFYEARGYRLAWVAGGRLTRPAEALLRAAMQSDREGLDTALYADLAPRAGGIRRASVTDWADPALDLDLQVSYALLRFVDEMAHGRMDPRGKSAFWALHPARTDVVSVLARASEGGLSDEVRAELWPQHAQYDALRRERDRYRDLASLGGWGKVEAGPALKPGQRSARVAALRARLVAGGDLPADTTGGHLVADPAPEIEYDAGLAAAVKELKARHGLTPNALVDAATVAALNVSVAERMRQIEVNLERWRWLPRRLGERYLLVNIPTFELQGYEGRRRTLHMRVVTGTAGETPTPVFAEEMTHVVFSPYWNVPPGIAREEVAPAVWHDRSYLARNNMEILKGSRVVDPWTVDLGDPGLRFRQRPGPGNSLGRVKFMFPNRYRVYLHDTPARSLFAKRQRDYSHGCVRVQEPFELAQWVFEGTDWTPGRIRAAMNAGTEKHVRLERPVPVYIAYFTVWVDDQGRAQFRPDVYRHDAAHAPLLPPAPDPEPPPTKVARTVVAAATSF
ncbi:MAG TPA: L,D-transpeptidase family protein [Vicinamibacteria bacterium]|nr:L,D-transpeptidase family protein [Vicinamibacteria bacterium]